MHRGLRTTLHWIGRALIVLAVYVLVCSFFLPSGVQWLNGAVCPDGLHLDNARYSLPGGPNNNRLELVCTSPEYSQSAAAKIALVVVSLVAAGLLVIYIGERVARPHIRGPQGPTLR